MDNPPTAVTLTVTDATTGNGSPRVRLEWSPNSEYDFKEYRIYRATHANVTESDTLVRTIVNRSPDSDGDWRTYDYPVAAPPPGTTYYYRIFIVDDADQSVGSNEQSITFVDNPPAAVMLEPVVDVSTTTSTRVRLSWSYNNEYDFKQYQLYRATHVNVTQSDTLLTTITDMYPYDGDHWQYTDSPPDTGALNLTYYYRVFVMDQADQATGSNEVDYVLPPGVPGFASFDNIGQTSLDATMPDLPVRAASLTLQMKLAGAPDSAYVDIATDQQAFDIVSVDDLYASTDYTFRVIAVGAGGSTPGQSSGVSTATAPPPAPAAPTFSDLQPDSVIVNGPPLPPSTDYLRLEIKLAGQNDNSYMTVTDNLEGDSTTLVSGLSADANYEFRFVAVGRGGETPGASAQLLVPHVSYGWGVGTAVRCDGIRWPENGATITASSTGRLSSFLARDWDARNTMLDTTMIASTTVTDPCSYTWSAKFANGTPAGDFPNGNIGQSVVWIAPATSGAVTLELVVDDQNSLNKGNGESGSRDDATLGYNDDPVTFTRTIVVQ